MSVTLKQIAEEVGVSQPLVTYALNGKPGVSEAMRQRILATAARMGYSPQANRAAKHMAARRHGTVVRTGVIALLLRPPGGPENTVQDNPFFLPYFNGVEIEASHRDYDLFVCALRPDGLPRLIADGGVDGVIGVSITEAFGQLHSLALPAISLGSVEMATSSLVPDEVDGIHRAVEHLVRLGHKRIAYLGVDPRLDFLPSRIRYESFRNAMASHSLTVDSALVETDLHLMERETGAQGVQRLLKRRRKFTALVCYNDLLAMSAVEQLQKSGFQVPGDIAVIGFDGFASQVGFRPVLTSMSFDRQAMGRHAVKMLCQALESEGGEPPVIEYFPTQLVQGETT